MTNMIGGTMISLPNTVIITFKTKLFALYTIDLIGAVSGQNAPTELYKKA